MDGLPDRVASRDASTKDLIPSAPGPDLIEINGMVWNGLDWIRNGLELELDDIMMSSL